MDIREFIKVFDYHKQEQQLCNISYIENSSSYKERSKRNRAFISFLNWIPIVLFLSGIIWIPISVVNGWLISFSLSIGPMFILSLSWMFPIWKWFEKSNILLTMTMGLIPIRIILSLAYILLINTFIPSVTLTLVLFMMWHWILFTILEIISIMRMLPEGTTVKC